MTTRPETAPSPFRVWNHAKKHIAFVDGLGAPDILPDLGRLCAAGHPVEFHVIGELADKVLDSEMNSIVSVKHLWPEPSDRGASALNLRNTASPELDRLAAYLQNQPMGTHLYIAGSWPTIRLIASAAEAAGYAPEDIQTRGYGPKYHQVFCIGCYTLNPIESASANGWPPNESVDQPTHASGNATTDEFTNVAEVTCQNCGRHVSVSDHYSRHLDAVLGYIRLKGISNS